MKNKKEKADDSNNGYEISQNFGEYKPKFHHLISIIIRFSSFFI